MNPTIKTRWLEALRSGEYQQTKSQLKKDDGFCCLGVLCDIVDPDGWNGSYHQGNNILPRDYLLRDAGIPMRVDSQNVTSILANMNDEGNRDFIEIANWIEVNL